MNDSSYHTQNTDNDTYTSDSERSDFSGNQAPPPPPYGERDDSIKTTFSRMGFAIALLTVSMIAAQYLLSYIMVLCNPHVGSYWWANMIISVVPLYGVALPILLFMLKKIPAAPHNTRMNSGYAVYDKPAFGWKQWLRLFIMGMGLMYIGSYIGDFLMNFLTLLTGYSYENPLNELVESFPLWATLLMTCVIAPLGEEFIFRKLFIDRARRFGDTAAILLSGLIFGLFHGNFFQFFYAAFLGILLAYIYTRTGNLWWCAGMHAAANLMGGIVIPALAAFLPTEPDVMLTNGQLAVSLLLMVWIYGTMIAALVFFIKRFGWRALSPDPAMRSTGTILREAVGSAGMIVMLVLLLGMVALSLIPPELLL